MTKNKFDTIVHAFSLIRTHTHKWLQILKMQLILQVIIFFGHIKLLTDFYFQFCRIYFWWYDLFLKSDFDFSFSFYKIHIGEFSDLELIYVQNFICNKCLCTQVFQNDKYMNDNIDKFGMHPNFNNWTLMSPQNIWLSSRTSL